MLSLSTVVITRNEAKRIQRCLESIRWVPEIIIVDDQSSDETVAICKRYTDKVIVRPLNDDFAAQRNAGIEAATRSWILQMDADEVVPEETAGKIERALAAGEDVSAYSLIRANYFLGREMRYGGWVERSVKLFRKEKGRYRERVHERLEVKGSIQKLDAVIAHYPFDTFSDCLEKLNRYTSLEAEMMLERDPSVPMKECYYQMKRRPLKVFWKIFVKKQGFREGVPGLVFALFWALGHFMKWAKYWELTPNASGS